MDRNRERAEVLTSIGLIIDPVLRVLREPEAFEKNERTRIVARYFSEAPKLSSALKLFTIGEQGHRHRVNGAESVCDIPLMCNSKPKTKESSIRRAKLGAVGVTVAFCLLLLSPNALGVGEPGNKNEVKNWCEMTAAQRACICALLACIPADARKKLEDRKGVPGDEGKGWKSPGTICRQKLEGQKIMGIETDEPLGRTIYADDSGKLKGVIFPPALFAAQGAEGKMWKKVAVSQEGNRLTYGDHAPVPYTGMKPGNNPGQIPLPKIAEYACWKNAFVAVNNGLAEAQDARSRSATVLKMVSSAPRDVSTI